MYKLPEWPNKQVTWSTKALHLLPKKSDFRPIPDVTVEDILRNKEKFPIKFPIDTVCCATLKDLVPENVLKRNINSAYPLVHENVLLLYAQFILHKQKYGNSAEKELYKDMTVLSLVERLLSKRAAMFVGRIDSYILIDGTEGRGEWNLIGDKKSKLTLDKCISYDEIKLSVFLSVSSYSYFINTGTQKNFGKPAWERSNVEDEGVVIGMIGARLNKVGAMEYQDIVINNFQNRIAKGYGVKTDKNLHYVFSNFYEEPCFTFEQMLEQKKNEPHRFEHIRSDNVFDNVVFAKRIALSIDTLLLEANHRAKLKNTTAYIYVIGIGLGLWKCSAHQEDVFVETFANRLKYLGKYLSSVSDIYFSYFNQTKKCGETKHGEMLTIEGHPKKGIQIYISQRDPHMKLKGTHAGKLLIVSYPWNGNALPGNEFWNGKLGSSCETAAAASTQISELHNVHINPKVCASNLQVVTPAGLVPFNEYCQKLATNKRTREDSDSDDD